LAITKERKEELVAHYGELLSKTDGFIVTEYRGLTMKQMNDLRARLHDTAGGSYSITKNTLFSIALKDAGWVVPEKLLIGPTAVIFGNGSLPAVAKVAMGYAKDNPDLFIIKGGVIGHSVFGARDIEAVSTMPTLEEIRAQLAGLIVQPASALAGLLNSATSQVVNVLQSYIKENGGEESAA
jgi:large subunit ribosomal protein L10